MRAKRPRRLAWPSHQMLPGVHTPPVEAAHYIARVLRLRPGAQLQLFDGQGQTALATLLDGGTLQVGDVQQTRQAGLQLTLAVACPKGERADWLVEKITELGVARLVWLQCARSVVHPGSGRMDRWQRLATSAARQCGRNQVPQIVGPMPLASLWSQGPFAARWVATPHTPWRPPGAVQGDACLLVGPEGGLTPDELQRAAAAGYTATGLSQHVLRVETAALAGAALLLAPATA